MNSGGKSDLATPSEVEHGIMLVLGNGKRTKPRRNEKKKSVHYSAVQQTEEFTPPPPPPKDGSDDVTTVSTPEGIGGVKEGNAGHTPPPKQASKRAKKTRQANIDAANAVSTCFFCVTFPSPTILLVLPF